MGSRSASKLDNETYQTRSFWIYQAGCVGFTEFKNYINNCDVSLASLSIIPAGVQSTYEIISNITDAGYKNLISNKVII